MQDSPGEVRLSRERRDVLSWMIPALRQNAGAPAALRPTQLDELSARVHAELVALVIELAARERVLIAIDDVHACDAESLAVLLGATRDRAHGPLVLAT